MGLFSVRGGVNIIYVGLPMVTHYTHGFMQVEVGLLYDKLLCICQELDLHRHFNIAGRAVVGGVTVSSCGPAYRTLSLIYCTLATMVCTGPGDCHVNYLIVPIRLPFNYTY